MSSNTNLSHGLSSVMTMTFPANGRVRGLDKTALYNSINETKSRYNSIDAKNRRKRLVIRAVGAEFMCK